MRRHFAVYSNEDGTEVTVCCLYCGRLQTVPTLPDDDEMDIPFDHEPRCPLHGLLDYKKLN